MACCRCSRQGRRAPSVPQSVLRPGFLPARISFPGLVFPIHGQTPLASGTDNPIQGRMWPVPAKAGLARHALLTGRISDLPVPR